MFLHSSGELLDGEPGLVRPRRSGRRGRRAARARLREKERGRDGPSGGGDGVGELRPVAEALARLVQVTSGQVAMFSADVATGDDAGAGVHHLMGAEPVFGAIEGAVDAAPGASEVVGPLDPSALV